MLCLFTSAKPHQDPTTCRKFPCHHFSFGLDENLGEPSFQKNLALDSTKSNGQNATMVMPSQGKHFGCPFLSFNQQKKKKVALDSNAKLGKTL